MTEHRLEPTPETTADVFDRSHAPVLTVASGDRVTVGSLDASGHVERQRTPGEQRPKLIEDARGHCLTGPIAVEGAKPGQWLALRIESLVTDGWGWTVAGGLHTPIFDRLEVADDPQSWLLWELDAEAGIGTESRGFRRALAPFLGVMGLAPAEEGEHSTIPPRPEVGGNIDCRSLVAGSTLYLPVQVPEALLYLGDGHAAQGDGEVGGTAIECPMHTTVTLELLETAPLDTLHAEIPGGRITFGFDADLNAAMGDALDAMTRWIQVLHDVDKATALALASTCVDLRVTQVANRTWGVHAVLADGVLEGAPAVAL